MACNFVNKIEGNACLGLEVRAQWSMINQKCQLEKIFKTEQLMKSIAAHNVHEKVIRAQEGGTAIVAYDHLATIYTKSGTDLSELGHWCWMKIDGKHSLTTRIVYAYQLCRSYSTCIGTVYSQ